jgi:hypothetical protein
MGCADALRARGAVLRHSLLARRLVRLRFEEKFLSLSLNPFVVVE